MVIAQLTPIDISKRLWTFGKMDLKSSKFGMCILFTRIKCNFFQKVAFYTGQMDFLGWLFSKLDFWAEKVETNGHLVSHYKLLHLKRFRSKTAPTYFLTTISQCRWQSRRRSLRRQTHLIVNTLWYKYSFLFAI